MISVIIPAHNEAPVIVRTLSALTDAGAADELEIIVVCNGCTDDTASVTRSLAAHAQVPVEVIETPLASKTHALNLGDSAAHFFPRVYMDADVLISREGIRGLAHRLRCGDVLAVGPLASEDLTSCTWAVRAYYEIRAMLPSAAEGIGGSGVYALSEAGRHRFHDFPAVTADDGFVRIQFHPQERATLDSVRSTVFPPKNLRSLIATKTRCHFGSFELQQIFPQLWRNRGQRNHESLLRLFQHVHLWPKLAVYCFVTIAARQRARRDQKSGIVDWKRDLSSRVPV